MTLKRGKERLFFTKCVFAIFVSYKFTYTLQSLIISEIFNASKFHIGHLGSQDISLA